MPFEKLFTCTKLESLLAKLLTSNYPSSQIVYKLGRLNSYIFYGVNIQMPMNYIQIALINILASENHCAMYGASCHLCLGLSFLQKVGKHKKLHFLSDIGIIWIHTLQMRQRGPWNIRAHVVSSHWTFRVWCANVSRRFYKFAVSEMHEMIAFAYNY